LSFKCFGVEDRDAFYRVFRNIIAMNRDGVHLAEVNIFEYEKELSDKDLEN